MAVHSGLMLIVFLFGLGTCLALMMPMLGQPRRSKHPATGSQDWIFQSAPFAIWVEQNGQVIWANTYCKNILTGADNRFAGFGAFLALPQHAKRTGEPLYELKEDCLNRPKSYSIKAQKNGTKTIFYAHDATQLVEVESELKRFIQTLTSTFAHLPIGLAVFDKERDLTLFNPALSSLLGLAPDWLARRPNMRAFLDRLRNSGSIPEPRDFTTLRHEFAELESGAFTGKYEVDWALPSGAIYRVTGRPHSEGGAALLFEDISRSAALEAQYRAELRQLYSALESLSDAVAIFDQAGELAYANDAFDLLWGCTLSKAVAPARINDVSLLFQKNCSPTPVWGELRNFVHDLSERSQWQAQVTHISGRPLTLTVSPIADGRVFCEFRAIAPAVKPKRLASVI